MNQTEKINNKPRSSHRKALYILLPFLFFASALVTYITFKYFNPDFIQVQRATIVERLENNVTKDVANQIAFVQVGGKINIDVANPGYASTNTFKPAATITTTVVLGQQATTVGKVKADEKGNVKTNMTIPKNLHPGIYTLNVTGPTVVGEIMTLYQNVYIYKDSKDLNGNGVPDKGEKCGGLVKASNQDQDKDGIDDACDGIIGSPN